MVNPLNKELQESRRLLEHYWSVLKNDENLKLNKNPDNQRLLTEKDIERINLKIQGLKENINNLLNNDNDYNWK